LNVILFVVRAPLIAFWVLAGLMTIALTFAWIGLRARLAAKKYWSCVLIWLCGVKVTVQGEPVTHGPVLWAVNHVSWIDIFVLNVVRPTAFVAKQEIRHWPVIGWLAVGADTIFIERGFRHAVHRVGQAMQLRFDRGQVVGLFPEGTTSDGFGVLPFYANLFEPARRPEIAIQPVALIYKHRGQRSALAAFVGEETLVQNLWRMLGSTGVSVDLVFLPVVAPAGQDKPARAELARSAHHLIEQTVALGEPPRQPR
jgi:1-acyl-sn-glycerol-3-phosphate acyltransferase